MFRICFGFTLLELLGAITLLLILIALAAPLPGLLESARADGAMKLLMRALQYARMEAINRRAIIIVCGTRDEIECVSDWHNINIMIFADTNNNKRRDSGEPALRVLAMPAGRVSWRGSGRPYMRYRADGTAVEFGTYTYCAASRNNRYARQLTINAVGRPYLSRDKDGDGIHENSSTRKALDCASP